MAKLNTKSTVEPKDTINSHICSRCKNHIKIDNKASIKILDFSLFIKLHTSSHPFLNLLVLVEKFFGKRNIIKLKILLANSLELTAKTPKTKKSKDSDNKMM